MCADERYNVKDKKLKAIKKRIFDPTFRQRAI